MRRPARLLLTLAAAVVVGVLAYVVTTVVLRGGPAAPQPGCTATAAGGQYTLGLQQAGYATTIAAIGKQRGLPDHAVTVALAAALQESKLRNLPGGDRDSVGLFQQRPSQGWGQPAQLLDPRYAAAKFYQRLAQIPGWEAMPVTEAAQHVQRSASPDAYAQWESEARALAAALTGERPAAFSCRFVATGPPAGEPLAQAMAAELGPGSLLGTPLPAARGWTVASWLVARADAYRLAAVSYAGWTWTRTGAAWTADRTAAGAIVRISTAASPTPQ